MSLNPSLSLGSLHGRKSAGHENTQAGHTLINIGLCHLILDVVNVKADQTGLLIPIVQRLDGLNVVHDRSSDGRPHKLGQSIQRPLPVIGGLGEQVLHRAKSFRVVDDLTCSRGTHPLDEERGENVTSGI